MGPPWWERGTQTCTQLDRPARTYRNGSTHLNTCQKGSSGRGAAGAAADLERVAPAVAAAVVPTRLRCLGPWRAAASLTAQLLQLWQAADMADGRSGLQGRKPWQRLGARRSLGPGQTGSG